MVRIERVPPQSETVDRAPECTLADTTLGIARGTVISELCRSQLSDLNGLLQVWLDTYHLQELHQSCTAGHSDVDSVHDSYLAHIANNTLEMLAPGSLAQYQRLCSEVQHLDAAVKIGSALLPQFQSILEHVDNALKPALSAEKQTIHELLLLVRCGHHLSITLVKSWRSAPSTALASLLSEVSHFHTLLIKDFDPYPSR